jgi:hypothetical protein
VTLKSEAESASGALYIEAARRFFNLFRDPVESAERGDEREATDATVTGDEPRPPEGPAEPDRPAVRRRTY